MAELPRSKNEAQSMAAKLATAGDVKGLRALIQALDEADTPELAEVAGMYIETAISYRDDG